MLAPADYLETLRDLVGDGLPVELARIPLLELPTLTADQLMAAGLGHRQARTLAAAGRLARAYAGTLMDHRGEEGLLLHPERLSTDLRRVGLAVHSDFDDC